MIDVSARRDEFLSLVASRRAAMGILNVTPDSFSDGGRFAAPDPALAQAARMAREGADIIDVGAESTRPGHSPVHEAEEWRRLEPVLTALGEAKTPLSIDTTKATIARRAATLGACLVNDVWGLQKDAGMADAVAETGAALIVMHNRDAVDPAIDIEADIRRFFDLSLDLADRAGIVRSRIMLDPGIGFGKNLPQNLAALAATARLRECYGLPIVIGVSRKRMFGDLVGAALPDRLAPTIAANLAAAARGARLFRVHDVAEHVAALKVLDAIERA